jgi:predicted DNA-binding transcriptional regulator YafY
VLRTSEKDHLEEIEAHVAVVSHPTFMHERPTELHLPTILKAIASASVLHITYTSMDKNECLCRKIEPVGIYYQGSHWYLIAFCRLRNDYRNFRTDKINTLVLTGDKMLQTHPPLQSFINKMTAQRNLQQVVIDVPPEILKYFGQQKYYNGFVKEEPAGDAVRMTFLTGSLTGFARWYLLFGEHATIIEPLQLNDMVAKMAGAVLKKIKESQTLLT